MQDFLPVACLPTHLGGLGVCVLRDPQAHTFFDNKRQATTFIGISRDPIAAAFVAQQPASLAHIGVPSARAQISGLLLAPIGRDTLSSSISSDHFGICLLVPAHLQASTHLSAFTSVLEGILRRIQRFQNIGPLIKVTPIQPAEDHPQSIPLFN